jgi:UDP-2-acetamido-3-amino-2,3-dideoxy-glucuronate N-acetyltransferase
MASEIHPNAVVAADVEIGHFSVIERNATIEAGCRIGHHVVIREGSRIGVNVRIDDHATVGKRPMKAANSATTREMPLDPVWIDDDSIVGTSAIIYRGARIGTHVLIADQASVREQTDIGDYTIIGRGVTVENRVTVGHHTKIEAGAYIASLSTIGSHCFIAPEVTVTNDNFMGRTEERKKHFEGITIADGGRVGANVTTLPGRYIARDGVVAAGSVVTRDVPAEYIVSGIPARLFKSVPREQLLDSEPEKIETSDIMTSQIDVFIQEKVTANGQH